MAKILFINQLQKGQLIEDFFGITLIKRANDRNGKPYIDLELTDKSGSIKAKVWSDYIQHCEEAALKEGNIVKITGIVGEFNSTLQLTINSLSNCDEKNLSDYLSSTDKDIGDLWEKLEDAVDDIQNERIKAVLTKLLETYEDEIRISPAARSVHHNFIGGLLEHVNEMLEVCGVICKLYPEADGDIVTAGIILHDIGKIFELKVDGFQINYTTEGKLLGHIVLGVKMLNELGKDMLEQKELMQLEHIILSHHFVLEFGSPVTPRTIEAMIVSKIDDLSSKTRLVQKVIANNKDNKSPFAPREFGLDGEVYLGN